jgi:hypothetical protein
MVRIPAIDFEVRQNRVVVLVEDGKARELPGNSSSVREGTGMLCSTRASLWADPARPRPSVLHNTQYYARSNG